MKNNNHTWHQSNHSDCIDCLEEKKIVVPQREESWRKLRNSYRSNYQSNIPE